MKKLLLLLTLGLNFFVSIAQDKNAIQVFPIETNHSTTIENGRSGNSANSVFAAPGNDQCTGATTVTPNGTCVPGTTVDANDSWNNTVGCQNGNNGSNHPDVWYSFVATGSQFSATVTTGGTWAGNVELVIVEGTCSGLMTLVGSDCGASPLSSSVGGLTVGTTYFFTISNANGGTTGSFTVCPTTTTPPVVPGQDCSTAAVLCDNSSFSQGTSSAGFGTQEVNSSNSCFGGSFGERQSKWYKFTIGCSGTLEFMITPNNYNSSSQTGDDYDWALWNSTTTSCPTTANTTFDAIACNWDACVGSTGIASNPTASFGTAANTNYQANNPAGTLDCRPFGGLPYQWESTINVTAGQTYSLLIDNFTATNNGFGFRFGGTATIGPSADFTYVATGCNAYNFTKTCQVSNSTFLWTFGDGGTSTSQNPSHAFTSSGVFTVTLEVTDNLGCTKTSSATFTVGLPDITAGANQIITCTTPSVQVSGTSTTSGATYSWAGPGIVSGGSTNTATVNTAGTYTVTVTNPANSCTNSVTVSVTTNTTTPNANAGSDASLTCAVTSVALSGSSSTGGATFSWAGPSIVSGGTTATPTVNGSGTYTLTVTNPANGCTATDQAVVSPDANIPNANAGSDQTLTCTATSVNLNGSSTTGGVNFSWAGPGIVSGGSTATPNVNVAGTYTLTVTNPGNGCTSTDQAVVSLNNTAPNANAGSDAVITCASTTVQLSGSSTTGGVNFNWTGAGITAGGASATPTVNAAGNFTLTVTNPVNGCTATDVASVTTNTTLPNASAGSNQVITCTNPSVTFGGSSSTGGVTFSWTGPSIISGGSTATATANAAGIYTLTVTNPANSCVNTSTVSVTTNTTVPTVNAGGDATLTCAATSVNLTGASITPGATFSWAGPGIVSGAATATVTVNAAGTYTLTVTDPANGCVQSDNADVTPDSNLPNANAGNDHALTCITTSVVLGGSSSTSGVNFSWAGPGIVSGGTTATPTVNAIGTYTMTVTNPGNGCTSTDQVDVTSNTSTPNVNAGSPQTLTCLQTSVVLGGSSTTAGATYSWAGPGIVSGGTTATPTVNVAGDYTITVTDPANGCTNDAAVTVATNVTTPDANAGSPNTLTCTTLSVQLNGSSVTPNPSYSWAGAGIVSGGTTATPTVNAAGTYTLTVTDPANGCTAQATVIISSNTAVPNVAAGNDETIICGSPTVNLVGSSSTGGVTFAWTGSGIVSGAATATVTVNAAGTYTLTVTDPANGCTATDNADVTLDANIPNADAGTAQMLNCSVSSVVLNGSSTTSGVDFSWAGSSIVSGGTTATPTVDAAGTYTLTVTNPGNGCTNTATVTVTSDHAQPDVTPGADQAINCITSSVNVTVSSLTSGVNYSWAGTSIVSGGNTNSATVNAAGVYTVTVTNPVSTCTNSTTVNVTSNISLPNANAGVDTVLTCTNTSVILAGSSTTPSVGFSWAGAGIVSGGSTATPTVNAAGTYTLTVNDPNNGCTNTDQVVVAQNIAAPNVAAGNDVTLTCGITTVNLSGSSSTPNTSYSWAGAGVVSGGNTLTPSVNIAGSYTLTVADNSNGCTATDIVDVIPDANLPNVNPGNPQTINCTNASVTLSGSSTTSGVTFSWAGPGGFNSGSQAPSVSVPGSYSLTVTNPSNSCSATQAVTVSIDTVTPSLSVTPSSLVINCSNPNATLTAATTASPATIAWAGPTGPLSGNPVTVATQGTYTVGVLNTASGCVNSQTVTITGNNNIPAVSALTSNNVLNCAGPTAVLSATSSVANATYAWSGPGGFSSTSQNPATPISTPGIYTVVATDPFNGCTNLNTVTITQGVNPNAVFNTSVSGTMAPVTTTFTNSSTNSTTYTWNFGNGTGSTASVPSAVIYTTPGVYVITLVASNGTMACNDTMQKYITVDVLPTVVVPNIFSPNGDGLNDVLSVSATGYVELTVDIFNRWGSSVSSFNAMTGSWDGKDASEGTYFYILKGKSYDNKEFESHGSVMLVK